MDAVAIDYFDRTAGLTERGDDFDWQPHRERTRPETIAADAAAAIAHLRVRPRVRAVFTVGFCFGGSNSWRLAASDLDLAGAVGFYGKPELVRDVLDRVRRPVLMLVAGADTTPLADFVEMDRRLADLGAPHEMHVYQGAPHSFFDRSFDAWADACADAWRRILEFTARHS